MAWNAKKLTFPKVISGSGIVRYIGVGERKTGPGKLLFVVTLDWEVVIVENLHLKVNPSCLTVTMPEIP